MAIYPTLFGHVEIPGTPSPRDDRRQAQRVGIRLVRPVDPHTDKRRRAAEGQL